LAQHDIQAEVTGTLWKILVKEGDIVAQDQTIAIIEAMKMEIPIVASDSGVVVAVHVKEGDPISEGGSVVTLSA
jgi:acetyl-CoA carboxylase biotin carboxyl carrier protein